MEAKDTVMSDDWLMHHIIANDIGYPYYAYIKAAKSLVEAQAEITGKIMYDEGFKAGQKEVVEWIDKHPVFIQNNTLGIKVPIAVSPDWGVQLKEWEEE